MTTTMTSKKIILTGLDAINYARVAEVRLRKHADPIEGARGDTVESGLTINQALAVARIDASLIWCEVTDADAACARNLARQDVADDVDDSYARTGDAQDAIRHWYEGGDPDLCEAIDRSGIEAIGIVYAQVRAEMAAADDRRRSIAESRR